MFLGNVIACSAAIAVLEADRPLVLMCLRCLGTRTGHCTPSLPGGWTLAVCSSVAGQNAQEKRDDERVRKKCKKGKRCKKSKPCKEC